MVWNVGSFMLSSMTLCTSCLPWPSLDTFPVFDIWGNDASNQTRALNAQSMITWFPCKLCQTKIISLISMWFRFQEESHEMKLGTPYVYHDDHDLIQRFLCLALELRPQTRSILIFFLLWSQDDFHMNYASPKTWHLSQCDLGVKRNHTKQGSSVYIYHGQIQCFLKLCTCLPWPWPDTMFPLFDTVGNDASNQTRALIFQSMVTGFSCELI